MPYSTAPSLPHPPRGDDGRVAARVRICRAGHAHGSKHGEGTSSRRHGSSSTTDTRCSPAMLAADSSAAGGGRALGHDDRPRATRWVTTTVLRSSYRWHPCVASVTPSPPHPAHISAVLVQTVAQLPPHGCPARMLISSARPARCPLSIAAAHSGASRCSFQARYTALYIYIAGSSTSRANQFQRSVSWYKPT